MDYRALSQMELGKQPFPQVQYDFRIYIDEAAFDRICSSADLTHEVGGILVGDVLQDENGPFIRVDHVIEALHAEEKGTELTITHDTWNHIHEQMDKTHSGKRILGWYHTHPNFGIFLSEQDQFIQQSFFNLAFQVALVYDPVRKVHGVFSWRDSKPWRVRQYWIGTHQHLWDEPRERSEPKKDGKDAGAKVAPVVDSPSQGVGESFSSAWVLAVALVSILFGFVMGSWWGRNSSADNAQIARDAVSSLNTDLLAVIRGSVTDEAGKTVDDSIARLGQVNDALKPMNDPTAKSANQAVTETREALGRLQRDRLVAQEMLKQLDVVIKTDRTPESVSRDLAGQRVVLGEMYVELAREAARTKDAARVAELLKRAAAVNPPGKAEYEQQLKGFEQQGVLP
jgi:proteasome lid subunit RPN8/RPN11